MKYIDADLLRKKVEKLDMESWISEERSGFYYAIDSVLEVIDSFQQEQPKVNLDSEIEDYWIATEWSKVMTLGKFKVIARYFYGLGQLNAGSND